MSSKSAPEKSRAWSLAGRLTVWYGLSAFALIAASTGFLYWALLSNLDREDDEFLADKIHLLQTLLRERPDDARMLEEEVEWEPAARRFGQTYVRIAAPGGRLRRETPGMSAVLPTSAIPAAAGAEPGAAAEVTSADGRSFRVLAARADGTGEIIQAALDRTREEELLRAYRRYLWLALGVSLVICLLAGHRIARRGLRPLREVTDAARRTRASTLHERLATARLPTELADLAATFNEMLDRLQESFDRLSRFSADIAHELRNPVNSLRGEAEVALARPRSAEEYRDVLASGLEECGRLSQLIDSLLLLARSEDPQTQIAREPVDVGRELEAVREYYEPAAGEAGVTIRVHAPEAAVAPLDRALLQRAVGNLVANSLAHTPAGGTVTLSARREGPGVIVEVADTGEGIAPEHLPYVFDRFYRADAARATDSKRVGLGLALVKGIAALHGGSVKAASEPGKGTRVTMRFPR